MSKTVAYLRDLEKIPIIKNEMKDGFQYFTIEIEASQTNDKVDGDTK
jgi:hypothetical protein